MWCGRPQTNFAAAKYDASDAQGEFSVRRSNVPSSAILWWRRRAFLVRCPPAGKYNLLTPEIWGSRWIAQAGAQYSQAIMQISRKRSRRRNLCGHPRWPDRHVRVRKPNGAKICSGPIYNMLDAVMWKLWSDFKFVILINYLLEKIKLKRKMVLYSRVWLSNRIFNKVYFFYFHLILTLSLLTQASPCD